MLARAAVLGVVLLAASGAARAESPAEIEAKHHYRNGKSLFDAARYAEALEEFTASYQLSKYPALIYNIALCQDQLGKYGEARASYQLYLAADPATQRRAGIEDRLHKLNDLTSPPAVELPPPAEPPSVPAEPTPAPATTAVTRESHESHESRPTPVYKKWWLWTVVGVVVAGAAVGLGLGLTVGSKASFDANLPAIGPNAAALLRF